MSQLKLDLDSWLVSKEEIDKVRAEAKTLGFRFSYSNRSGKQYIKIEWNPDDPVNQTAAKRLVVDNFSKARITSASWMDYTFRINPY